MEISHFNLDMILVGVLFLYLVFDIICCVKKNLSHKKDTNNNRSPRIRQFKSLWTMLCVIFKTGKLAPFCSTTDSGERLKSYTGKAVRISSNFFLSDETVRIAFKVNQICQSHKILKHAYQCFDRKKERNAVKSRVWSIHFFYSRSSCSTCMYVAKATLITS